MEIDDMTFQIITADERIEAAGIKIQVWGPTGIGKTTLALSLDGPTTLFIDLEAGMRAIPEFVGRSVSARTWTECRDLACWVCGPNPGRPADQAYSQAHYEYICNAQGGPFPAEIKNVFIDSTTNAARYCFQWAETQPEGWSDKGVKDTRGAYGLLAREIVAWFEIWQHAKGINVIMVGGLELKVDEFKRATQMPMIEGAKGAQAIPYIFDQVVTMTQLAAPGGEQYRGLVCLKENPWGLPAKDRSGRLDLVEPPHLGRLIEKMSDPNRPRRPLHYELGADMTV